MTRFLRNYNILTGEKNNHNAGNNIKLSKKTKKISMPVNKIKIHHIFDTKRENRNMLGVYQLRMGLAHPFMSGTDAPSKFNQISTLLKKTNLPQRHRLI